MQALAAVAVERNRVVRNMLAEIALDDVDAGFEQRAVRVSPPSVGGGIGEIEEAAFRQRGEHVAEG